MAGVSNEGGNRDGRSARRKSLARFVRDEGGATVVEYTFLIAFIALGVLAAMRSYSDKMIVVYNTLATAITTP